MLTIILAWIVIFYVLLSFGDIFISLYNKLCKCEEQYNITDTFILGICSILIPLSFSSLWLPSNHYILFIYLVISCTYWILNKERLKKRIHKIKNTIIILSVPQKTVMILSVCGVLLYVLYCACWTDALIYHYSQIQWNEEYPVIPGMANLEDRFAFNSNYLLLSAIFTFRFLLGEPLYALQSILFILVMFWILKEVITSGFHISRIILLFIFLCFFILNADFLADSSTDIVPNLCVFYFIARFTLYPELLNKRNLLIFILPITLCTFKMSVFPLCFLSIYILFSAINSKRKALPVFLITSATLIVSLWLVRNVIICGYLVYPLSELDIFSFDWKIPAGIAKIQKEIAISVFAKGLFKDTLTFYFFERSGYLTYKLFFLNHILALLSYLIIILSPFILLYHFLYRKNVNKINWKPQLILYISLIVSFIYWLLFAPDIRFASGIIYGSVFFIVSFIFFQRNIYFPKLGRVLFYSTVIIMVFMSVNRSIRYHTWMEEHQSEISSYNRSSLLIRPFSAKDQCKISEPDNYTEYKTNGVTIYVTKDDPQYGALPLVKDISPDIISANHKLQSVYTIEARGNTLKDGFRTKKEYINIIDSIANKYLMEVNADWW
ncbi:hypothetical protein M2451_000846 [Dysgonomonas sp. PFB1-18]|uniref:LIC_10190 family membrane protein n=1 Tax=unclassified Dysgonomonas TaxID=2630389 RepID=UPI002475C595|nr:MULTISPECIES: hypothetical protein [unclassified Dysgonomonas]MDH6308535.1 hypothetical protein [Dysgonomonas sp. PF1-14]MDH6338036.1 hypothetical protein [Dysgonomonas sp. PF1-16]MDH6379533.1 hypothetical protein [Dysgonomonas sp. PFB1-18]MDH6396863.1 hypothetical protein [Dysgonomonas sp. PF1-23]